MVMAAYQKVSPQEAKTKEMGNPPEQNNTRATMVGLVLSRYINEEQGAQHDVLTCLGARW